MLAFWVLAYNYSQLKNKIKALIKELRGNKKKQAN